MFGRRAFSVAGPAVWNSLPDYLRDPSRSADSLRRDVKTVLFSFHWRAQRIAGLAIMRYINPLLTLTLTYLSSRFRCATCTLSADGTVPQRHILNMSQQGPSLIRLLMMVVEKKAVLLAPPAGPSAPYTQYESAVAITDTTTDDGGGGEGGATCPSSWSLGAIYST